MSEPEEQARRAKFKTWLWRAGIACAIVYPLLVAIWYFTGAGEFWPLWAMYAMGGILLFLTWGAFSKQSIMPKKE